MEEAEKVGRYPPDVEAFLEDLRPDEVQILRAGIRLVSSITTVGSIAKWAIILACGVLVGIGGVGEAILKIWHWIVPPVGPKQ